MLDIINRTRLTTGTALFLDAWGRELACVAAKATFTLPRPGQDVQVAEECVDVLPADVHHGDPGVSSIKYPADLVPAKLGTDVLLVGSARSPWSQPVYYLDTSLRVGALARRVRVFGDRVWDPRTVGVGFRATEPALFTEMPLVYERAFGGRDPLGAEDEGAWDPRNPVGAGFRTHVDAVPGAPLPNLEDPDQPLVSWGDRPPVAGFGAVDGPWEPRRRFAGTYDAEWEATQAPLLPRDFDARFFNVAPPGLSAAGFLQGGEPVELVNVGGDGRIAFVLPSVAVKFTVRIGDSFFDQSASLWTVLFEPDADRFTMTWGLPFLTGKQPSRAYSAEVSVDGHAAWALAAGGPDA